VVGIIVGTYSSIYVASPLLLVWPGRSGASRKAPQGKKSAAKA
jgi:preprotein translocase subunit SecF